MPPPPALQPCQPISPRHSPAQPLGPAGPWPPPGLLHAMSHRPASSKAHTTPSPRPLFRADAPGRKLALCWIDLPLPPRRAQGLPALPPPLPTSTQAACGLWHLWVPRAETDGPASWQGSRTHAWLRSHLPLPKPSPGTPPSRCPSSRAAGATCGWQMPRECPAGGRCLQSVLPLCPLGAATRCSYGPQSEMRKQRPQRAGNSPGSQGQGAQRPCPAHLNSAGSGPRAAADLNPLRFPVNGAASPSLSARQHCPPCAAPAPAPAPALGASPLCRPRRPRPTPGPRGWVPSRSPSALHTDNG